MTNSSLALAETRLLLPSGLDQQGLDRAFSTLLGPGIDFGDLYFQHSRRESWTVEDGIVKDGAHSIEQGVGVRAISGEKTGFAYSDDINSIALLEAAHSARAIARDGSSHAPHALVRGGGRVPASNGLYSSDDPIDAMDNDAKVEALRAVDRFIRAADPRVQQVTVSLSGGVDTVLVARSDGVLAADVRPLVRLNVQVIVEQNGRRESGYAGMGGRYAYTQLFADAKPEELAREALRQALVNLDAVDAPAGVMPVVLGSGWPGVLLHEAVGHGLEGDFNRKGTSTYAGRMGQRVASPGVTIVDDGTLPERRGSLNIDDEGTPTECTTLIEDGVLVGYMQDTLNARLMGMQPTGNGRRESFAHLP
ncbi:MAG TPA: metallopeptidase TldD-related protein, partial [Pseudoxanthomonas sp.]